VDDVIAILFKFVSLGVEPLDAFNPSIHLIAVALAWSPELQAVDAPALKAKS
jgi:hypothetical protein